MNNKRGHVEIDPDYEDVSDHQAKRQRVLEQDAKEATVKKIENIIKIQFEDGIHQKETEVNMVDQRLNQARLMMDRLRACVVACQYSGTTPGSRDQSQPPSIHPTVKQRLGKAPVSTGEDNSASDTFKPMSEDKPTVVPEEAKPKHDPCDSKEPASTTATEALSPDKLYGSRGSRFKTKRKIIVGNVSKFIPVDRREVNDQSTHKWMMYVRGSKEEPDISSFVKKVWFFLHPSYKPNDLVEIMQPPFHLTRRGWGEFPVRVQLHFCDQRNKRVDIIHNLKLDKTCTGLQTLGAETIVEVELEKEPARSNSPLTLLSDGSNKHTEDTQTSETTIPETVTHHEVTIPHNGNSFHDGSIGQDCEKAEAMEVDKDESSHSEAKTSEVPVISNLNKAVMNGDHINSDLSINSEEKPKVIHLKPTDILQSKHTNSNTESVDASVTSTGGKAPGAMYMRCRDKDGNIILLPYKLNHSPSSVKPDGSKTANTDMTDVAKGDMADKPTRHPQSLLNPGGSNPVAQNVKVSGTYRAVSSGITPTATSTQVQTLQPGVSSSPVSTSAKPSTNLVLKVTPSGLKLVPADSDPSPSSTAVQPNLTETASRPKLKSLLNPNIPFLDSKPVPKSPVVVSSVSSAARTVFPNAVVQPKQQSLLVNQSGTIVTNQTKSNMSTVSLLTNQTVPNVASKQASISGDANPSLVVANIGDKHYLLKVVPKDDKNVLLVPNKPVNTPNQTIPLNQARTVLPQKSLLTSGPMHNAVSQKSEQSLKFSFGLSPFNAQNPSNQSWFGQKRVTNAQQSLLAQKASMNFSGANPEKRIYNYKKKVKDYVDETEPIKPLVIDNYPDLVSVVRAAVRRHPVVQAQVDRHQHPYCARSKEEWLSWNIGKRRASEWQRAVAVKNFIKTHVQESSFKGEQLWTTKKILSWCRLHAFSPHHLETMRSDDSPLKSPEKHIVTPGPMCSLSEFHTLQTRVEALLTEVGSSDDSDDEIDIISLQLPTVKVKTESIETSVQSGSCEVLPPSDQAIFVQDTAQQIGVRFRPVNIEADTQASASEDMIYNVMRNLAEDILREAFSISKQSKSSGEDMTTEHVFKAISNMDVTNILSNSHLGLHDNIPSGVR